MKNRIYSLYALDWTEYERGWGQRPDGTTYYASKEEAQIAADDYNKKYNNEPVAPDYYVMPSKPYLAEVDEATYNKVMGYDKKQISEESTSGLLHEDFRYEEAEKALIDLLKQIASVKCNTKRSATYNGPEILSSSVLVTSPNIAESFTKDAIAYNRAAGRNKLQVFISKVFQLGYSVGYEKGCQSNKKLLELLSMTSPKKK